MPNLLAIMGMGPTEMVIVGIVAVLLFGKRLPEVGRGLGKSIIEFKKGLRGIEDEFRSASSAASAASASSTPPTASAADDQEEATAPKFEPPTTAPQPESTDSTPQTV